MVDKKLSYPAPPKALCTKEEGAVLKCLKSNGHYPLACDELVGAYSRCALSFGGGQSINNGDGSAAR